MKNYRWCENCMWWGGERKGDHDGPPVGMCRIEPPRIVRPQVLPYHDPDRPGASGPLIDRADWPWTAFDDWCGKFQKRTDDYPHIDAA